LLAGGMACMAAAVREWSSLQGFKTLSCQFLTLYFAQVPVGRGTLGRIINVIGEPVDECGPVGECVE